MTKPRCIVICKIDPEPQCPEDLFEQTGDGGVRPPRGPDGFERDGGGGDSMNSVRPPGTLETNSKCGKEPCYCPTLPKPKKYVELDPRSVDLFLLELRSEAKRGTAAAPHLPLDPLAWPSPDPRLTLA